VRRERVFSWARKRGRRVATISIQQRSEFRGGRLGFPDDWITQASLLVDDDFNYEHLAALLKEGNQVLGLLRDFGGHITGSQDLESVQW